MPRDTHVSTGAARSGSSRSSHLDKRTRCHIHDAVTVARSAQRSIEAGQNR